MQHSLRAVAVMWWFSNLSVHQNYLESKLQHRLLGPTPRLSDSVGFHFCKFQDDVHVAGRRTTHWGPVQFSSVQSLSRLRLFAIPCTAARQASLSLPTPGACSNSCPSSRWCHPTLSPSVIPFSSCPQSFPASESFPMSWLFTSGGQSIGASASASVLPVNIQYWFPLGLTGLISFQYSCILEKIYFLEKMSRML